MSKAKTDKKTQAAAVVSKLSAAGFSAAQIKSLMDVFKAA